MFIRNYLCLLFVILCGCKHSEKKEIILYSAAGISETMIAACDLYKMSHDVSISVSSASSGTLARQIEEGAPAHIYVSASAKWADYLESENFLKKQLHLCSDSIVVVTAKNTGIEEMIFEAFIKKMKDSNSVTAIPDPDHAPAGAYVKEAIQAISDYNRIKNNLVPVQSVTASLMLAQSNDVDYAFVYASNASRTTKLKIVTKIPASYHRKISFRLCRTNKVSKEADLLYEFLKNDKSTREILNKFGYITKTGADDER
ncbi:MAG: molybdate ABC transporter substrate-binding protein [Spirochaetes bacterium]|nr:molybdate ABC transporter substrate-binding protein [Spirochaetota bacterium]